jgi:hypothetical protein
MKEYAKLIVALAIAGLTTAVSALGDGRVSAVEVVQISIAVVTALGVWVAGHVAASLVWPKTVVAAALAVLDLLVTYVGAGPITPAEWINLVLAALGVLGVGVVPAAAVKARVHAADGGSR